MDALKQLEVALNENLELKTKEIGRGDEIAELLQKENFRLDCLLNYHNKERSGVLAISDQSNSVLMHYNELQSRSVGRGIGGPTAFFCPPKVLYRKVRYV